MLTRRVCRTCHAACTAWQDEVKLDVPEAIAGNPFATMAVQAFDAADDDEAYADSAPARVC